MSKVTVDMLKDINVCKDQIRKFQQMFGGKQAELTKKNVQKALRKGMNVGWFAQHFTEIFSKEVCLVDAELLFLYAKKHGADSETRLVACSDPIFALKYAKEIDRCIREDTRNSAYKGWLSKYGYQRFEEQADV